MPLSKSYANTILRIGRHAANPVFLWIGLYALLVARAVATVVEWDEAAFLSYARHVFGTVGWSTTYEFPRPFDPKVTAGPLAFLPAGLGMLVYGAHPWVARAINSAIVVALCALTLRMYRRYFPRHGLVSHQAAWVLLLLVFTSEAESAHSERFARAWYQYFSDIWAIFLLVLGAERLHAGARVGSLLIGLACMTKVVLWVPAAGILGVLLWGLPIGRRAAAVATAVAPGLAFYLFRAWRLNAQFAIDPRYREVFALESSESFLTGGSGIAQWRDAADLSQHLARQIQHGFDVLVANFHGDAAVIALGILWIACTYAMRSALGRALMLGGTLHLVWWWLIGDRHWPRHLFPGTALLLFACLVGLRDLADLSKRERPGLSPLRAALLAIALLPWVVEISEALRRGGEWDDQTPAAQAAAQTVDRLLAEDPRALLVGCGHSSQRDIDFFLAAEPITENCQRFNQRALEPGRRWILVRNWMWNYWHDPAVDAFAATCERTGQVVFSQASYRVTVCSPKGAL